MLVGGIAAANKNDIDQHAVDIVCALNPNSGLLGLACERCKLEKPIHLQGLLRDGSNRFECGSAMTRGIAKNCEDGLTLLQDHDFGSILTETDNLEVAKAI
ncbi:1-aminocyclopropane-1-carboxylate oxidase-like protein [Gossypium australe]|uniref:1-aminocyclopropane-1-carboxylate oxidase-like protein n=1 Tax=Gossypium australe TaxID=47621 RepID=A0A5B6X873_9ROSI|nr:1-aminocyclopropane-1-carboxylate oxidase-like protein [Gossypium australe]